MDGPNADHAGASYLPESAEKRRPLAKYAKIARTLQEKSVRKVCKARYTMPADTARGLHCDLLKDSANKRYIQRSLRSLREDVLFSCELREKL
jgi:hypothetical protein